MKMQTKMKLKKNSSIGYGTILMQGGQRSSMPKSRLEKLLCGFFIAFILLVASMQYELWVLREKVEFLHKVSVCQTMMLFDHEERIGFGTI